VNFNRAIPLWLLVAGVATVLAWVVVPLLLHVQVGVGWVFVLIAPLVAISVFSASRTGHAQVATKVAPAPVFSVVLDRASLAQFGVGLAEEPYYLAVATDGLHLWTVARDPQAVGQLPWTALASSTVDRYRSPTGHRAVALEPVRDGAVYIDVKVPLSEMLTRPIAESLRLFDAISEHVTPARPDPAHTPPRAQSD